MGKKIISFSVWGTDTKYTNGALKNIEAAKEHYPDWTCRFYVANNVPRPMVEALELNACEVVKVDRDGDKDGLFWRFYPAWDPEVDVFLVRDTDSLIGPREAAAVKQWMESDKPFHIMRDSISHSAPIMGGMWGAKQGFMPEFKAELDAYVAAMAPTPMGDARTQYFNSDQLFLSAKVWPVIKNKAMAHDEYHCHSGTEIPYPRPLMDGETHIGA